MGNKNSYTDDIDTTTIELEKYKDLTNVGVASIFCVIASRLRDLESEVGELKRKVTILWGGLLAILVSATGLCLLYILINWERRVNDMSICEYSTNKKIHNIALSENNANNLYFQCIVPENLNLQNIKVGDWIRINDKWLIEIVLKLKKNFRFICLGEGE